MKLLADGMAVGLDEKILSRQPCEICIEAKQCKQPFQESESRKTAVLQLIHSDLCGPLEEKTIGGAWYVLTFIDDYSRKVIFIF